MSIPDVKPVVIFFPFPFLSHYLRCIVLARILAARYRIVFAGHISYNHFVRAEGFDIFPCANFNQNEVLEQIKRFEFSWLKSPAIDLILEEQCKAIRLLDPALIFSDSMPTAKIAAEITRVPHAAVLNTYMTTCYAGSRGVARSHFSYPFVSRIPAYLSRNLIRWGESVSFKIIHSRFRQLRKRYVLKKVKNYLTELEGDLNFCVDLPEMFALKGNTPENFSVVGPLIYDVPANYTPKPLRLDPDKKTIFVSMGSTGNWDRMKFLLAPEFLRYNIITAGDSEGVLRYVAGLHLPFISASDILPFADLVICHGGNGTLYQAMQYGKPVLCSAANFEQQWNVDAVVRLGLGSGFTSETPTPELISQIEKFISAGSLATSNRMSRLVRLQQRRLNAAVLGQIGTLVANKWQSSEPSLAVFPRRKVEPSL